MNLAAALFLLFAQEEDRVLQSLRERVGPSVVAIEAVRESDPEGEGGGGPLAAHRDYFSRPRGPASGVIYEPDGFIVTSGFNVSGVLRKDGLKVTLHDGREFAAELRGCDAKRDIALLKIGAKDLPALPKADFSALGQGSFVAVVGRSPDKRSPTVNAGILSALNRMDGTAVQTDAAMNYGNAGGALVTLKGELVGVGCHVKPLAPWGQSGGIGFACKVPEIDKVLDRMKKGERIAAEPRPYLGIRPGEAEMEGARVFQVAPDSPAGKAGFKVGDVIVAMDGREVADDESLRELLAAKKIGDEIALKVRRGKAGGESEDLEFKVKLEGRAEP